MWDSLPNFSQDITEHYFSIWNNELSWLQTNLRLKDVFCVPDATTFLDEMTDVDDVLRKVIEGKQSFLLILGAAGSGKTSLIAYLYSLISNNKDIEFRVWALPVSLDSIPTIMAGVDGYARKNGKQRVVLVFENIDGHQIDIEKANFLIKQKQGKLTLNMSVIITSREDEITVFNSSLFNGIKLCPFSYIKIESLLKKFAIKEKKKYLDIIKLGKLFGDDVIGNPVILSLFVFYISDSDKVESQYDLLSLLLDKPNLESFNWISGMVAFYMFTNNTGTISKQELEYLLSQKSNLYSTDLSSNVEPNYNISTLFVHSDSFKKLYIFEGDNICFSHSLYYELALANWVIYICLYKNIEEINYLILQGFQKNKLNENVLIFIEALLKRKNSSLVYEGKKNIENFIQSLLVQNTNIGMENTNFLVHAKQEMTLFFNMISIYHSILKILRLDIMFNQSKEIMYQFQRYLKIYASVEDNIDINLSKINFSGVYFKDMNLKGIDFSNCTLDNCRFINCNLAGAKLRKASMRRVNIDTVNFSGADLSYTDLTEALFCNSNLMHTKLYSSDSRQSSFSNCNLSYADFRYANLRLSNLLVCKCERADFSKAKLVGTNLGNSILSSADFTGANLKRANLLNTVFDKADFTEANLEEVFVNILSDIN